MKLGYLHLAGREPTLPLTLGLNGHPLQLLRWLRVLPGQRYVAEAFWQGQRVLAKLVVGPRAERHFRREREGWRLLREYGMPTPDMLARGYMAEEGGWLLFEYLEHSTSLDSCWRALSREPLLSRAQRTLLAEALALIARLHVQGLWQADLHLDNLLRQGDTWFLIDGGGVRAEQPGKALSTAQAEENLGVLFAQLSTSLDPFMAKLLDYYRGVEGAPCVSLENVFAHTLQMRRWRLRNYLKKVGRECTLFSVQRSRRLLQAVRRSQQTRLESLLQAPDAFIEQGHRYKGGGSATVVRVQLEGPPVVVKRYNIKHIWHGLQRCWRPSRAWHSWREGHRLELLGISTAAPLAVLERRWWGLRRQAYLVTDCLGDIDIIEAFAPYVETAPPEPMLQALERLFNSLVRERISHGDLKGHNLLWLGSGEQGRWALIDLDAMHQHRFACTFRRAYRRDRARFLRNWPEHSALYRLLEERLPCLD